MRGPSSHRGRVRSPWGRSEGVTVFEMDVALKVRWEGCAVFSGASGQPRRCATCAESSDELEFQAHSGGFIFK